MDDLISRQAAIDAILHITNCKSVRELFEYNQLHHLTEMWSGGVNDAIDAVIGVDSTQLGTNLAEVGTDTISRKQAIDALNEVVKDHSMTDFDAIASILDLPSAQPHVYRGVTLNDVLMYFDSLEGNEDAWTEFCSCLECRGWGLYHIRSATDKNVGTTDTINRQQAIDAVTDELDVIDHVPQWVFDRLEGRLKQLPPVAPKQPDCAKCKSELANKIRGQQDNPGMLTENDKGRNWGLEWTAQIVEGKRR